MGLYAPICNTEYAAGSPTTAAKAAREHFGTDLALLAGRRAHKTQKKRSRALSAGQSLHMGLSAHICTSKFCRWAPYDSSSSSRRALWQ